MPQRRYALPGLKQFELFESLNSHLQEQLKGAGIPGLRVHCDPSTFSIRAEHPLGWASCVLQDEELVLEWKLNFLAQSFAQELQKQVEIWRLTILEEFES